MQLLFENNATTTIAGSISPTSTTINLATGSGALFPNPISGSQYFTATLQSVTIPSQIEIVWVTARAGDVCTVVRNQENTTAAAFAAGDTFAGLITAGWFTVMQQTSTSVHIGGMAVYFTPGTYSWVPPANVTTAFYEVWGGGGGGGGCSANSYGTGGGGGGYTAGVVTGLTPSTPVSVVVGGGGAGGSIGGGSGSYGTTSYFGAANASPGQGGAGDSDGFGAPGIGSGGTLNFSGIGGGFGQFAPTGVLLGGAGGPAFKSPGPLPGVNAAAGTSPFPGAGGNGAGSNTGSGYSGGSGAGGMVIITWS